MLALVVGPALGFGPEAAELRRLVAVQLRPSLPGLTVVEVDTDRPLAPYSYRHYRVAGAEPRQVLCLVGVAEAFPRQTVAVDDGTVRRLRIGLHHELEPPEAHLVFDLEDAAVEIVALEQLGSRLLVTLASPAGFAAARAAARAAATEVPWASPTPGEPSPTRTVPPPPTPTPALTPTVPPPVAPTPTATATVEPAVGPTATPTPPPVLVGPPEVLEITTSRRPDGTTLMRISTDQALPPAAVRHFRLFGTPPRFVVGLAAATAPSLPSSIRVGDLCLAGLHLVGGVNGAELQIVLELAATGVTVARVAHQGRHVVVELTPPE